MAKILKIDNDIVSVGNDDGSLTEIRLNDCNFNPNVGDEVNIFTSENKTICVKAEKAKEEKSDLTDIVKAGGININLTQNQGSNNIGVPESEVYYNAGGQHVVGKVAYILWGLFLGGLGAHKFYAGKTGQGILYLIFCWTYIPAILALIDIIIAATKPADANGRIVV